VRRTTATSEIRTNAIEAREATAAPFIPIGPISARFSPKFINTPMKVTINTNRSRCSMISKIASAPASTIVTCPISSNRSDVLAAVKSGP